VQIGISVSTYYDGKVIGNLKRQMVPIRSAILMVLSEQDGAALSTAQGKHMLQAQLTKAINQVLRQTEGFGGIDNVYFTTLVIQ
jgi:flagellar FliL protein